MTREDKRTSNSPAANNEVESNDAVRRRIAHVVVEKGTLEHEVGRVFEIAAEQGSVLEQVGSAAREAAGSEAFSDAPAEEIYRRAMRLRGAALQAFNAALELAGQAGKLQLSAYIARVDVAEKIPEGDSCSE